VRPGARGAVSVAALAVVYWSAHTMLRPLIAPSMLELGSTPGEASAALAAIAVLPTLLAIPIGSLTDRFGDRRVMAWGAVSMVAGGLLLLPAELGLAVAGQVVVGVGTMAAWVALQAAATSPMQATETRDARNSRIATFSFFVAIGQLVGPLLGGSVAEAIDYRASFAVFVGLSVVLLAVTWWLPSAAHQPPSPDRASRTAPIGRLTGSYADAFRLMRRRGVGLTVLASFVALVALDLRMAFHPIYLSDIGYSPVWVGALLSAAAGCAFLSRPVFTLLVRRLPSSVLVGLVLGLGSATVGAVVLTESIGVLFVLAALNGLALGLAQPLTLALMAEHTDQAERGLAAGVRSMGNRLAQLVDPIAFGILLAVVGTQSAFLVMGSALLLLSVVTAVAFARLRYRTIPDVPHPVGLDA
jgi:MFS family permease